MIAATIATGVGFADLPPTFSTSRAIIRQETAEGRPHFPPLGTGESPTSPIVIREHDTGTGSVHFRWDSHQELGGITNTAETSDITSPAVIAAKYISRIRTAFGLTIKSLASILEVGRPTIYGWIREERNPQASNMEQLERLHDLATAYLESGAPHISPIASSVRLDGSSIVELLRESDASLRDIEHHVELLVEFAAPAPTRPGSGIRARALTSGLSEVDADSGQTKIDLLTGKVGES